jgi:hypothetical protein
MAMVNEKSSSAGSVASATLTARPERGCSAGSPKGSWGCAASGLDLPRRAWYASRRSSSSPCQAGSRSMLAATPPRRDSAFRPISPRGRDAPCSSNEDGSVGRLESQKLHARTLDGSTAPHCKHVFVTGAFCAADASTPARRERIKIPPLAKVKQRFNATMSPIRQRGSREADTRGAPELSTRARSAGRASRG